jgi:DNA-binding response OmpR family regulator
MASILLVEDEAHLAEGLRFNLEAEGHEVEIEGNGRRACERLADASRPLDLVILDLMLPEVGGVEVLRRARAAGNYVPVLILSAKAEVVRGLEEGADDYMVKPFQLGELLARTRGLLRRRRWDGAPREAELPRRVAFGDVVVHFDRFEIESPRGTHRITTREAGLLRALIEREGEAVKRGELLEEVWGLRPETRTRVVDSFIVRLRRYVEPDPARPRHIVSVRGHGYRFVR